MKTRHAVKNIILPIIYARLPLSMLLIMKKIAQIKNNIHPARCILLSRFDFIVIVYIIYTLSLKCKITNNYRDIFILLYSPYRKGERYCVIIPMTEQTSGCWPVHEYDYLIPFTFS